MALPSRLESKGSSLSLMGCWLKLTLAPLVFGEMRDSVEAQWDQGSSEQRLEAFFAVGTTIEREAAFANQF